MTDELDIWGSGSEWLHVVPRTCGTVALDILPPTGLAFVAWLDGAKMTDDDGVFEQFWDRFKFPDYFGWNWPALSDCLRDLRWLPADRYLVVVENPGSLLSDNPGDRETLLSTLARVAWHWSNPHEKPRGVGIPFNVVLACDPVEAESVRSDIARLREGLPDSGEWW
ncbi:barstar family protein [Streptomyces sp. UNOC14_S4]|uniref:barstar family protein n=1 Tax=Streptomyces sp. UNOC14_S4 TaxID=2872340 RepID=UPI001E55134E|nr:barstar family protein [Streptomyces sp. UNOC14_S4]MCC3769524.1 barstar family protein [Streptomyces sp. UNOC14_S4]